MINLNSYGLGGALVIEGNGKNISKIAAVAEEWGERRIPFATVEKMKPSTLSLSYGKIKFEGSTKWK